MTESLQYGSWNIPYDPTDNILHSYNKMRLKYHIGQKYTEKINNLL